MTYNQKILSWRFLRLIILFYSHFCYFPRGSHPYDYSHVLLYLSLSKFCCQPKHGNLRCISWIKRLSPWDPETYLLKCFWWHYKLREQKCLSSSPAPYPLEPFTTLLFGLRGLPSVPIACNRFSFSYKFSFCLLVPLLWRLHPCNSLSCSCL